MSEHKAHPVTENTHGLLASYVAGFVLSVAFTLYAYGSVTRQWFVGRTLSVVLIVLALIQFGVQLFFFLHVGRETKPRWKLLVLALMVFFAIVVIAGSIWVMYNLNYHMTPQDINQYMQKQADGGL